MHAIDKLVRLNDVLIIVGRLTVAFNLRLETYSCKDDQIHDLGD